jgi:hypothetical protein
LPSETLDTLSLTLARSLLLAAASAATFSAAPAQAAHAAHSLQGYWTSSTVVPLQRPKDLGDKTFFTPQEAAEYRSQRLAATRDTEPGTTADVHYQLRDYGLDRSQNPVTANLRTSIISDPPNGRLPPVTAAAEAAAKKRAEYRQMHGFDSAQDRPLAERCILWPSEGPPMMPVGYNSNLQIVQSDDYVIIVLEMIHDARVIPLDGRPHLPGTVRQWLGDSSGHWEGDTLVIETTNFTGKTTVSGVGRNLTLSKDARVVERLRRIDDGTLLYQFTVDDPNTWTQPWSGEYPLTRIDGPIFEYACHEGNYGLPNTLSGARAEERKAAQRATESNR